MALETLHKQCKCKSTHLHTGNLNCKRSLLSPKFLFQNKWRKKSWFT